MTAGRYKSRPGKASLNHSNFHHHQYFDQAEAGLRTGIQLVVDLEPAATLVALAVGLKGSSCGSRS